MRRPGRRNEVSHWAVSVQTMGEEGNNESLHQSDMRHVMQKSVEPNASKQYIKLTRGRPVSESNSVSAALSSSLTKLMPSSARILEISDSSRCCASVMISLTDWEVTHTQQTHTARTCANQTGAVSQKKQTHECDGKVKRLQHRHTSHMAVCVCVCVCVWTLSLGF